MFNYTLIDKLPKKPCMLESDIFPVLAEDGQLYAKHLDGFWMDVGNPKDFIIGTKLYLEFLRD